MTGAQHVPSCQRRTILTIAGKKDDRDRRLTSEKSLCYLSRIRHMGIPSGIYIWPHVPSYRTEDCLGRAECSCATRWSRPARPGGLPYAVLLNRGHTHTRPLSSIEVCSLMNGPLVLFYLVPSCSIYHSVVPALLCTRARYCTLLKMT